jgi:hypothetical protein
MSETSSLGPRKRKASSRVAENADPLLERNKRTKATHKVLHTKPAAKPKASQQQSSVTPVEGVGDGVATTQGEQPPNPQHILDAADRSDNSPEEDPAPESIMVDDGDDEVEENPVEEDTESAEHELGACHLFYILQY